MSGHDAHQEIGVKPGDVGGYAAQCIFRAEIEKRGDIAAEEIEIDKRDLVVSLCEACRQVYRDLSARGLRVIAVAVRPLQRAAGLTVADERDLTLSGFVTFADPPLPGVAESIAALRRDGVAVKILTGDNELVTEYICKQVGIDDAEVV